MKSTTWILPHRSGRRFRAGHPWLFANELASSPKGVDPGSPIEIRDERGLFLARGYGNPHSLICFRSLSRDSSEVLAYSPEFLAEKVIRAGKYREQLGLKTYSHRLVFGEADDLPGLVIDRFVSQDIESQVLVIQLLTAGIENIVTNVKDWVSDWCLPATGVAPEKTRVVVRRDVGARRLEGLKIEPPEIVEMADSPHGLNLNHFPAWIRAGESVGGLTYYLDLISGQKTGFFFDQAGNVELLLRFLPSSMTGPLRVLDLFCYVGQWGSQIANAVKLKGAVAQVDLVDGSEAALALASENVSAAGGLANTHCRDILEGLGGIPDADIVVCDPPAFIKSKKDHGAGFKGYVKANVLAMNKVKKGGWFVSCSCSHHLSDSDFLEVLRQAELKSERRIRYLARGVQAPDHPIRMTFPEGQYLKAWIGRVID